MEVLKFYEFGDPSLLTQYDYDLYLAVLLMTGDKLRLFWQMNVKRYFNRTKPNYFTKSGELRLQMPTKRSNKSVLANALDKPEIVMGSHIGVLPLKNVVKTSDKGSQVQLVKLLMKGAPEKGGMHFDGVAMRPGGRWKGFPASYWERWDNVFMQQCSRETMNMAYNISRFDGSDVTIGDKDYTMSQLVDAYRKGEVTGMIGRLL